MTGVPGEDLISENLEERHVFNVVSDKAGQRLDAYLANAVPGFSRSRFKDLIKAGHVSLNNSVTTTPNQRLKDGDQIICVMPPPEDPVPKAEAIPISVVYEDDDLIVIDKPADMVVHPAVGNWSGTLVNALIHHCGESLSGIGGVKRPGVVHRLDKETSGLLVVAKNDHTHQGLAAQFADHGRTGPLRRAYKAFVWQSPPRAKGTIETEIGRSSHNRLKMAVVSAGGREAITHYDVDHYYGRENNDGLAVASLVNCHLETGRTHQIRVHMTHIGCPLVGDPVYSSGFATKADSLPEPLATRIRALKRQALHAYLLAFEHPRTGNTLSFESNLPDDLAELHDAFTNI